MLTIKAKREKGQLVFNCPWCNKKHRHGLGDGPRSSHCSVYHKDYFLVEEKNEEDGAL